MSQRAEDMLPLKFALDSFRLSPYQSFVDMAESQGYGFSLLTHLLDDVEMRPKLYRIVGEGILSSPQSDGTFETFEEFCDRLLQPCYIDVADSYIIATFEDEWIGLTGIIVDSKTLVGKSGLTVVQKDHQGKGIAKALKALSLAQAAKQGATIVVTANHVDNAPMLAVNRLLGFVPDL